MTFEELKNKYKGISIKPLDESTGNSKGYFSGNNTVYIYRSEILGKGKNSKNGFYVDGTLFLLPDILKERLQAHYADQIVKIPEGIEFDKKAERFKCPLEYLQKFATEVNMTLNATPTKKDVNDLDITDIIENMSDIRQEEILNIGTYTIGNYIIPILNKVAETAAKYRIMESQEFFLSTLIHKRDIEENIEFLSKDFTATSSDESLVNLILACILYQKAQ